jgi:tetratricopeptide (TPR) repeat protein
MSGVAQRCPEPDVLDALASGRIDARTRAELEEHLDGCEPCSSVVAELARVYGSSIPPASPGPVVRTAPLLASVGRYKLIERIGEGGMGVVYVAHDPELDRRVALKLLRPEPGAETEERRTRLMLEAQAMAKLSHPNVVTVHDVGRVGEQLFLAMELVDGVTLSRFLARERPSRRKVLEVALYAGRGLAAAHGAGLVHRDFKPDNVLVGNDGRVRVTDFGLARVSGHAVVTDARLDVEGPTRPVALTATGMLIGTPAYMAPEQWRGEEADAKSDQFAFAVTLYESLFGVRPHEGATMRELATNVLAGRMRPFPPAPRWLRTLIERALSLDPAARFPSIDALLSELGKDRDRPRRIALSVGGMVAGTAVLVTILHFATLGTPPASGLALDSAASVEAPGQSAAIPARCEQEKERELAVWSEDRRAHLARVRPLVARDAADRLSKRLEAATRAMADARVAACVKEKNDTLPRQRKACLAERHREVEAIAIVLDSIDDSGGRPYADLLTATYDLSDPALCASDAYLRARGSAFLFGDRAEVSIELDEAAKLHVLSKLDRWSDADMLESRLLAKAESTTLYIQGPAIVAEMRLAAGAYRARRSHVEAFQALGRAAEAARDSKDFELEARIATLLVRIYIRDTFDIKEADRWAGVAEAKTATPSELGRAAGDAADARGDLQLALGELVKARASFEKALRLRQDALGAGHPEVAAARAKLVTVLGLLGDEKGALDQGYAGSVAVELALGSGSSRSVTQQRALGEALIAAGQASEAVEILERAREVQRDFAPIFRADTALVYDQLAWADLALLDFDGAETRIALGEQQRENAPRREAAELAISKSLLAEARLRRGDAKGAVKAQRAAIDLLKDQFGMDDVRVAFARLPLARNLALAGDEKAALEALDEGAARIEHVLGAGSPHLARFRREKGLLLLSKKESAKESLSLLDAAWMTLNDAWGMHHPDMGPLLLARAEAAEASGDREQAKRLAGSAVRETEQTLGPDHPETKRAKALAAKFQ